MKTITLGKTGIRTPQNAFGALPIQRISRQEAVRLPALPVLFPVRHLRLPVPEVPERMSGQQDIRRRIRLQVIPPRSAVY